MNKSNSILTLGCLLSALTLIQGCATTPVANNSAANSEAPTLTLTQAREVVHIVGPHERLGDIALKYTGNATNWQAIAKYNRISDPHKIRIGSAVKIPPSLLPQNNPALKSHSKQPATSSVTSPALAIKTQSAATATAAAPVVKSRTQGAVVIQTVSTNRSFDLTPIEKSNSSSAKTRPNARVKVIGTYYPKGIYQQPANYSNLLMRAAPGTLFELEYLANDWYKVVTSEGVGYLREADGAVIMSDKKL